MNFIQHGQTVETLETKRLRYHLVEIPLPRPCRCKKLFAFSMGEICWKPSEQLTRSLPMGQFPPANSDSQPSIAQNNQTSVCDYWGQVQILTLGPACLESHPMVDCFPKRTDPILNHSFLWDYSMFGGREYQGYYVGV